jgi:uncharacterized protein (DUF1778 family)
MALKIKLGSKAKSSASHRKGAAVQSKIIPSNETSVIKRERLEARITTVQKRRISKAAAIQGRSLTDFVISTLEKEAKKIIAEESVIELSDNEQRAFFEALENPPKANDYLKEAFKKHSQLIEQKNA